MADDIKIKLGLDATDLFNGLDQALNQVNTSIKNLPDVGDAIASDLPKAQSSLNSFVSEQKQLLVALKLQGKEGSDSYKEIEKSIIDAKAELNKLEQAAKDVDASLEAAFDGEQIGGFQGALAGLKGGLSDAFSGGLIGGLAGGGIASAVQTGVGAIVDGFGAVVDAGRGLISAQGDLQAQTGATGAEFEALKKEAEDAFLGGVGESVADATKVIANAKVVLKDALPVDQIGEFTAKAQALGNMYDKDVNEVIAKSTPFIKQFGLQGDEAFNLIAFAAKEGKTSQDDVLDTLAEYSQLLQEAGFSAEEFAGQMAIAGQEGLFNTDKIADSIKEAQIRLKAGDTAKAFADIKTQLPAALGDTLGNLEQLASSGQITIKEFLAKSGESIKTAFDSGQISEAMASQLQVAVAGTPAEDIGVEAYNKMFGAPIPVDEIKKKAEEAGKAASGAVGQYLTFDAVGRNLSLAFETSSAVVVKGISDAFGMIATAVAPAFQRLGATISEYFTKIWTVIGPILTLIGANIITGIVQSLNMATTVLDIFFNIGISIFDAFYKAIEPIINAFSSIGKTISDVFGGGSEGATAMDFFQNLLAKMGDAFAFIGNIISTVVGGAISFILSPLQLVGNAIGFVVQVIGDWIKSSGILQTAINAVNGVIGFFQGIIKTLYEAFQFAQNEVNKFTEFIGVLFEAVNGGRGIFDGFVQILNSVWEIIKNVGTAILDFGSNIITKYFIDPIKTAIDWVGQIIGKIGAWVSSLPGVQKGIQIISDIITATGKFFGNIGSLIDGVKVNIAGIVFALGEVGNIAKTIFDNILSLNFTGAINAIAEAPARIKKAFEEGKKGAAAFIEAQNNANTTVSKTNQLLKETPKLVTTKIVTDTTKTLDDKTKDKDKDTDKDKDKNKKNQQDQTKDTRTELQKRQEAFKDFLQKQQNDRDTDFLNFKGSEEEKSAALKKRLQADAAAAQVELNKISRGVSDTEFNPIEIKIKPGKGENIEDVKQFYVGEFKKLQESIEKNEIKIKPDLSWREPLTKELADFIKEVEANAKDYAKVAGDLFKQSVNTQDLIDKAEKDFDNITNILTDQQVELTNKINFALSIGDTKAAESLQKLKDSNAEVIADTERRYFRFLTDSKKAMSENTVDMQIVKALQTSILDVFNTERIRKEQETNAKIREERLGALDQEESDLTASLAKREISFEEYAAKMSQIDKSRQDAMEETEIKFGDRIKEALDKTVGSVLQGQAKAITKFVETSFTKTGEEASESTKIIGAAAGQLATQFGALAASGQATLRDFAAASVDIALTALNQMVPIFIAEITGKQFAELGLAGIAAAAGLTIILNGLVMQARASAGFKDGVIDLEGPGTETSDSIPAWLSRGESVITASSTRANKEELAWMNANPGMSIKDYFVTQAPAIRYSVTEDGDLIKEVRKLREETRGLGKHINRNTHVEISGVLKADNNSIKAMIDSDRRRNARRG